MNNIHIIESKQPILQFIVKTFEFAYVVALRSSLLASISNFFYHSNIISHWVFNIILLSLFFILNISCTTNNQNRYITPNERLNHIQNLANEINQTTQTHYGNIIIKYDLLNIDNNYCFPSNLYISLITDKPETIDHFLCKLYNIKHKILLYHNNLLALASKNSAPPITKLKSLLSLHPQKHINNFSSLSNSEDIFSVIEDSPRLNLLDELSCLDKLAKSIPTYPPIYNYKITSNFGIRICPIRKRVKHHNGIDLSSIHDAKVFASSTGKVIANFSQKGYGNIITLDHGDGFTTSYAHLHRSLVNINDIVLAGQLIGLQGNTGSSTREHLHYEIRYNHTPLNPKPFLNFNYKCCK
ncbi:M23 family peptidase [Rickettsiales bacterium Ac37b]|nr:M23 family peptidase [Rickettsiales bacterium Ac37b]